MRITSVFFVSAYPTSMPWLKLTPLGIGHEQQSNGFANHYSPVVLVKTRLNYQLGMADVLQDLRRP